MVVLVEKALRKHTLVHPDMTPATPARPICHPLPLVGHGVDRVGEFTIDTLGQPDDPLHAFVRITAMTKGMSAGRVCVCVCVCVWSFESALTAPCWFAEELQFYLTHPDACTALGPAARITRGDIDQRAWTFLATRCTLLLAAYKPVEVRTHPCLSLVRERQATVGGYC